MPREAMGYDLPRTPRGAPWWLLAVVALLSLGAGAAVGLSGARNPSAAPAPTVTVTATTTTAPSATPSAAPSGSDDTSTGTTTVKPETTARTFMTGWLTTDQTKRKELLTASATAELTDQLMLTAPEQVPATKLSGLDRLGQTEFSAEFVARLANGDRVLVSLAPDPEAKTGWLVTTVEPWG